MKQLSLKNNSLLLLSFTLLLGCNFNNNNTAAKYAAINELNRTAEEYRKEGKYDSAITCYLKSLREFRILESGKDTTKDKNYIREMVCVQAELASMYNATHDTNNSISYAQSSLKWCRPDTFSDIRLEDKCLIALNLTRLGDAQIKKTEEQKKIYTSAKYYIVQIGALIDSLCPTDTSTKFAISCKIAGYVYKKIGDTSRADFYNDKYKYLYQQKYGHEPEEN